MSRETAVSTPSVAKRLADYPAGRFERAVLDGISDPAATDIFRSSWIISQALRISKPIDATRLATAFRQVVERHDTLRARFQRRAGGWRLVVEDRHRTGPTVTDLCKATDAEIHEFIARARAEPFDVETGPLFRVDLLKCGTRGDILLLRVHHLVTDGWSQIVVFDELIRAGFGLPFAGSKPIGYGAYLERFEKAAAPAQEAKNEAYWRRLLLPPLPMPHLGRAAKGLAPNLTSILLGPTARLTATLGPEQLQRLRAIAKDAGFTINNLVGAAFARVLAAAGGVDGIYFNTPFAGRTALEMRSFVGLACEYVPVRCDVKRWATLPALARAIGEQMRESYQHVPAAVTKCDAAFDALVAEGGGHLRQFECGMLLPETAAKGSLIAPMLDGELGRVIRVGPVEIEWLEAAGTRADAAEFDLRIVERKGGLDLILNYDTVAFTGAEAQALFDRVVADLASLGG